MTEQNQEIKDLIKNILENNKLRFEEHTELWNEVYVRNYISHTVFYIPSKDNYNFFISFNDPFDGFRYGTPKDYDARYDKSIEEIEKLLNKKEVKKRGRKV